MTITRTVEVRPTADELAVEFCNMFADEQAKFFSAVFSIAKDWPGAGWCQQSCSIVASMDSGAIDALVTMASHLQADAIDRIVAGSS